MVSGNSTKTSNMPNSGLVVSDTSPLLNLALIDRLDLLESQFSRVTVPQQVWDELTDGEDGLEPLRELRETGVLHLVEVERSDLFVELFHELDLGETAAICYAVEEDAALVLLDERDGRRVARRHDLNVTGVIGILLRGANTGQVDLEHELDALRDAGFWISDDLYSQILSETE
jgi:predicted nucleic acid-binding protein